MTILKSRLKVIVCMRWGQLFQLYVHGEGREHLAKPLTMLGMICLANFRKEIVEKVEKQGKGRWLHFCAGKIKLH